MSSLFKALGMKEDDTWDAPLVDVETKPRDKTKTGTATDTAGFKGARRTRVCGGAHVRLRSCAALLTRFKGMEQDLDQ
jgi:hypothetical protein